MFNYLTISRLLTVLFVFSGIAFISFTSETLVGVLLMALGISIQEMVTAMRKK